MLPLDKAQIDPDACPGSASSDHALTIPYEYLVDA